MNRRPKRSQKSSAKRSGDRRKVDWCRFTDFKSGRSAADLQTLCSDHSRSELEAIFSTIDERGLCPIHWAAIHNRSDLIEQMLEQGSPLRIKCKNKLFADGSPLHLAAMNGSIEAAVMLLRKCGQTSSRAEAQSDAVRDWLSERDLDGQTPLMRTAPPRSQRLDTVRDLLQKNLWSLSGRPAEMALYLIHSGADWRQTDSEHSMNLLYIAVINDYDDIVNMLIVIDRPLVSTRIQTKLEPIGSQRPPKTNELPTSSSDSERENKSEVSLLNQQDRASELVAGGLRALQLAILFSRTSMIRPLWQAERYELASSTLDSQSKLENVIRRSYWSNKNDLKRLVRSASLKIALALDITIFTLVWIPVYLSRANQTNSWFFFSLNGGLLIASYCLSLALALRVMLRQPGYLKRNTSQYLNELGDLTGRKLEDSHEQNVRKGKVTQMKENSNQVKAETIDTSPVEERVRLLCHKCRCIRQARSKHCNYCNRCIKDFDHHCVYLGNCIGKKNRMDFMLLHVLLFVTGTYGTVLWLSNESRQMDPFWSFIGLLWVAKYMIIGGISSFKLVKRACLGVTLYETIRADRIRATFGPKGPPANIRKSHKMYSTQGDSFWRFPPDSLLTGGLPMGKMLDNFKEFTSYTNLDDCVLNLFCGHSFKRAKVDSRMEVYKLV